MTDIISGIIIIIKEEITTTIIIEITIMIIGIEDNIIITIIIMTEIDRDIITREIINNKEAIIIKDKTLIKNIRISIELFEKRKTFKYDLV